MSRKRERGSNDGGDAERLSEALARVMSSRGFSERIKQSEVIHQWPTLVGPEIAAISRPISIDQEGTLFAVARTSAWVNELGMMERELLASVNRVTGSKPVVRIRWSLMR